MGRRRRRKRDGQPRADIRENNDPLQTYNVQGQPLNGHPIRDLWRGKSVFLVCGGPSINTIPYQRLGERGIASLGINNVSGYVPVTAMTFADPPSKFHYGVLMDPGVLKLVPKPKLRQRIRMKKPGTSEFIETQIRVRNLPNVVAFERECEFHGDAFFSRPAATWGNNDKGVAATGGPKTLNTMLIGMRLVHYLGARRVYLIGVDFGMEGTKRQKGNYAFEQAGSPGGNNNAYKVLTRWFEEIKAQIDDSGMQIFNCNPESRLTLFPHVPFDHAVEDCRAPVPVEPFDLEGWYEDSEDRRKSSGYDPDAE